MSIVLTVWLVILAVASVVVFFYIFPMSGTSLLRYRLWPLRDELVDAMRHGEFEDDDQPKRLLRLVEASIDTADELRPLHMIILMALLRRRPSVGEDWAFDLSHAHATDVPRLQGMNRRYVSSLIRHLLYGSPSALVFAVVVLPTFAILALLKCRSSQPPDGDVMEEVKEALRKEISVEPTLRVLGQWPGTPRSAAL